MDRYLARLYFATEHISCVARYFIRYQFMHCESYHVLPILVMYFPSHHALSSLLVVSNTEQLAWDHFYANSALQKVVSIFCETYWWYQTTALIRRNAKLRRAYTSR